jgi:lactate dehydrogenase-like 2-hydroxyacid dehydrogenase
MGRQLTGKVLGIFGMGRIGTAVGMLALDNLDAVLAGRPAPSLVSL